MYLKVASRFGIKEGTEFGRGCYDVKTAHLILNTYFETGQK